MVPKLLTGEEETVYGDGGYLGAEKRENAITKNTADKRSNTKPIADPCRMKTSLSVLWHKSSAGNKKSDLCQAKSRAILWCGKGSVQILKKTIPRATKATSNTVYSVCSGKPHSGWQTLSGSLIIDAFIKKNQKIPTYFFESGSINQWQYLFLAILRCCLRLIVKMVKLKRVEITTLPIKVADKLCDGLSK